MAEALNDLEAAMLAAMAGQAEMNAFLAGLAGARIVVPTATEVQADGSGLSPLIHVRDGVDMVVAFTHPHRINAALHAQAPYQLEVEAGWLIRTLSLDLGLVLFGGPDHGLTLSPAQLAVLRQTL
jgi:hypothetical protein